MIDSRNNQLDITFNATQCALYELALINFNRLASIKAFKLMRQESDFG